MQRSALVFSFLWLLGSCGTQGETTPAKKTGASDAARPKLPKPLNTTTKAMFKLRELIARGRQMGSNYNGKKLFEHSGLKFDERCLTTGSVQVHELKTKGGPLRGAIFQVRPKSFTPCEEDVKNDDEFLPPAFCTVTLVGREKLLGQTFMPVFGDNTKLDITLEPGRWGIDLIAVDFEESGSGDNCSKSKDDEDTPKETTHSVGYFSLIGGTLHELDSVILSMESDAPGDSTDTKSTTKWYWLIIDKVKTPVLVVTAFEAIHSRSHNSEKLPDGGEDESGDDAPTTCNTMVSFYKLNPQGTKMTEVSKKEDIAALRKHKTLARIPLSQDAEGDDACEKLRP